MGGKRRMKKFMKIFLLIIAVIVAVIVGLVGTLLIKNKIATQKPYYKDDYYRDFVSDCALEQTYAGTGAYEVSGVAYRSENKTIGNIRIWYPSEMNGSKKSYPLIVVTNASNTAALNYKPFFERLASWGFVVIGNDDRQAGTGKSTSETLDYILALNADPDSIFYGKINEEKIGCVGYSQGGAGAINAVTKFENSPMFSSLFTGSAAYPLLSANMGWSYDASLISIPYFMTAGTGTSDDTGVADIYAEFGGISPLAALIGNYEAITANTWKVMARVTGAEHEEMLQKTDGYMTAWMLFTLCVDSQAEKVFAGEDAELKINGSWQDIAIRQPEQSRSGQKDCCPIRSNPFIVPLLYRNKMVKYL